MEALEKTDPGTVELFDVDGNHLDTIGVGAQPDMLTFHERGKQLLVANEGEPADDGSVDPRGSVSVIEAQAVPCPHPRAHRGLRRGSNPGRRCASLAPAPAGPGTSSPSTSRPPAIGHG